MRYIRSPLLFTLFSAQPSKRTRHPREIYFCLLRSVGAKNYGSVSSDAHEKAGEKILPQGVYGRARPLGGRNLLIRRVLRKRR